MKGIVNETDKERVREYWKKSLGRIITFLLQFSSVSQSCPTLCNPMNCSTPGLPVHHQLPEFTQTLVHRVGDGIQPSHPGSSPSPPAPNPSQHQSLYNESTLHIRWPKYWSFTFASLRARTCHVCHRHSFEVKLTPW